MYYCDAVLNGRSYDVTLSTNERVIGVVEKGAVCDTTNHCVFYIGDKKTLLRDVFLTKHLDFIVRRHISEYQKRCESVVNKIHYS